MRRLDKTAKVHFKIYDVTNWKANNYNTHIAQHLQKQGESSIEIWLVNKI